MKRILISLSILSLLFLLSCQKESGFSDTGSGGNSNGSGTRLVKVVQKQGTDSVVIEYSYDASGRLTQEKITGKSAGIDVSNTFKIIRNSSGIITQTIQTNAQFQQSGITDVTTNYHYNTSTSRYTSSVFSLSLFGFTSSDSTLYTYDASGKIIKADLYQKITGLPYELSFKVEYAYSSAGNLNLIKESSYDPGTSSFDLVASIAYTFDTKVNSLKLGTEGVVLLRAASYGPNNATKSELTDPSDPTNNQTSSIVYTYNSNNMPATATMSDTPGGTISNIKYYYQ
jgi:YD repeat-containing protein